MTLIELPDLIQGSDEWHAQRRGLVTASVVGQLISVGSPSPQATWCPTCLAHAGDSCISTVRKMATPIKTSHDARTLRASQMPQVCEVANNDTSRGLTALLVAERITGYTDPTWMSDDMLRGHMVEPLARDKYAEHNGVEVTTTGFFIREEPTWTLGFSPDGLVGSDGLLEVKSPRAKTHIKTILADEVPARHIPQIQTGLLVTGRSWLDFISYAPGLPMFTKRVHPDPVWFEAIIRAVEQFERTAVETVTRYRDAVVGLPTTERLVDFDEIIV